MLVEDSPSEARTTRRLLEMQIPIDGVRFVQLPFQSEWIRDYGPMTVRAGDGSHTWIDADYVDGLVNLDPHEDRLPSALGALLEMRTVRAPIALHHGNLLSNGRGLCIATRKVLEENVGRGYDAGHVRRILRYFYGAKEVVFLEKLQGEPTGHVDMFATFTSPDTVVIGEYSPESDPLNAAILDRNAEQLASNGSPFGPLKVMRVPMPPRTASGAFFWPTYTNVAYANGKLLVPVYPGQDPRGEAVALSLYQDLLPEWTIVGIDAAAFQQLGGGIHCITLNLPSLGKIHRSKNNTG
jgi:agmatine/peptidylarginine deiminase